MRKKYWYYLSLFENFYEVVYSYYEIDLEKYDWVSVHTLRGSRWKTNICVLSITKPENAKIPNSIWVTIEQARREEILNELI